MASTPECPRCGYDLSGMAASRAPSCGKGICSECGLVLDWVAVLDQSARDTPGFFEHATRRIPTAFFVTLWRSFCPRRFWQWVRLEAPVSPRRLTVFVVAAPVISLAASFMVLALLALVATKCQHLGPIWREIEFSRLLTNAAWPRDARDGMGWGSMVLGGMFGVSLAPLLLLVLRNSLHMADVKRLHLVRVAVYSVESVAIVYAAGGALLIIKELVWIWRWGDEKSSPVVAFSRVAAALFEHSGLTLAIAAATLWLAYGVWCAVRYYLRLPHAAAIAGAVAATAALLAAIVGSIIYLATGS